MPSDMKALIFLLGCAAVVLLTPFIAFIAWVK